MARRRKPFERNKAEIKYHIINSLLAGGLVFVGAFADGNITLQGVGVALAAALIVAISKFKKYWEGQEKAYRATAILNFI